MESKHLKTCLMSSLSPRWGHSNGTHAVPAALATGNKVSFCNCNLSGTLAVTLLAEIVEGDGFSLKDNKQGRIMIFRRGNYSFLLVKLIMYLERQNTWVCMWVCVCVCFMVILPKEPKSLQRQYLIRFCCLCPGGICDIRVPHSGNEPEEQRGEGGGAQDHTAGPGGRQSEPLQPAQFYSQVHLPLD